MCQNRNGEKATSEVRPPNDVEEFLSSLRYADQLSRTENHSKADPPVATQCLVLAPDR